MKPSWKVHANGSFDLITPSLSIRNCFPAIEHESIRPLKFAVVRSGENTTIRYDLVHGNVVLDLIANEDGLSLGCQLLDWSQAPHWVHPLAGGRLEGVQRFFRQGLGFSGPTGFIDLEAEDRRFSY
jgi:hypothetical protein